MVPPLPYLTQQEMERENVDPPDEVELAKKLITNRRNFLQEHIVQDELQTRADSAASKKKRAAAPLAGALVDNGGETKPSPTKKQKKESAKEAAATAKEKEKAEDVRGCEGVYTLPRAARLTATSAAPSEDEVPRPDRYSGCASAGGRAPAPHWCVSSSSTAHG